MLDPELDVDKSEQKQPRILQAGGCLYKNQVYEYESEFYDGCESFCFCTETGEVLCNPIKCPSGFGLDVISPFCMEWENHDNFVPKAPMCCPPVPTCISDGSCEYNGQKFINYDNIPANLTGKFYILHEQADFPVIFTLKSEYSELLFVKMLF